MSAKEIGSNQGETLLDLELNKRSILSSHELFIDRICPRCGNTRFSITPFELIQPFRTKQPAILGIEDCICEGYFAVCVNPKIQNDVLFTLFSRSISRNTIRKVLNILFHPITTKEVAIEEIGIACNKNKCKHRHIVRFHGDFKRSILQKLQYPEMDNVFLSQDELIAVEKALFEKQEPY